MAGKKKQERSDKKEGGRVVEVKVLHKQGVKVSRCTDPMYAERCMEVIGLLLDGGLQDANTHNAMPRRPSETTKGPTNGRHDKDIQQRHLIFLDRSDNKVNPSYTACIQCNSTVS